MFFPTQNKRSGKRPPPSGKISPAFGKRPPPFQPNAFMKAAKHLYWINKASYLSFPRNIRPIFKPINNKMQKMQSHKSVQKRQKKTKEICAWRNRLKSKPSILGFHYKEDKTNFWNRYTSTVKRKYCK